MVIFLCSVMISTFLETDPVQYQMILPGIIYNDSVDSNDEWLGLIDSGDGCFSLEAAEFILVEEEGVFFEGEGPPGRIIELPEGTERPLVLLLSTLPAFAPGQVPTLIKPRLPLPADTVFSLVSDDTGEVRFETTQEGLFISAPGITQQITDTFPGEDPSGTFLEIIWAGDLDGDGQLDMILNDVSNSYLIFEWELYLSTEASRGQLMGKVASFFDVYY